ncbi:hypothetical protein BC828DRAFT_384460 [Blastocladiella britannica]|nr:hypothetical protein BC828DRAFT_384460 [Blastocladiella britannica]
MPNFKFFAIQYKSFMDIYIIVDRVLLYAACWTASPKDGLDMLHVWTQADIPDTHRAGPPLDFGARAWRHGQPRPASSFWYLPVESKRSRIWPSVLRPPATCMYLLGSDPPGRHTRFFLSDPLVAILGVKLLDHMHRQSPVVHLALSALDGKSEC